MWINTTTLRVLQTHSDVRQNVGNVSFPSIITEDMLTAHGYASIAPTLPTYSPATEKAVEIAPINIAGTWTQQWQVVQLTAEELAAKIPQSVTMRQARLALLAAGMLPAVTAAINAAGDAAKIDWEYAQTVDRGFGLVPAMAAQLGLTEAQIDALFVAAAAL